MIISPATNTDFDFMFGDVNQNNMIDTEDARLILRASVKLENYEKNSYEFFASDVDLDQKITSADARLVLRASIGLEKLPDINTLLQIKNVIIDIMHKIINYYKDNILHHNLIF